MSSKSEAVVLSSATNYIVEANEDYPDQRDWIYRPTLNAILPEINYPQDLVILDQGTEGACTGFAIAASINLLNQKAGKMTKVSARMLYEMAKRHDEWNGEQYSGSSLRGAIDGWRHMGVCDDSIWQYSNNPKNRGDLTLERAKNAQTNTLGAYYRLNPEIADYHAAINETGVVACSSKVHNGWKNPQFGIIDFTSKSARVGGHAFAIVGYNNLGFWVQNSWGNDWGNQGIALWTYEDWIENIMDGWVFRPALSTPQIFGSKAQSSVLRQTSKVNATDESKRRSPRRDEIAGHFLHIDDGEFAKTHRYWSTRFDVKQTISSIQKSMQSANPEDRYQHILFYGHGGLNSPKASANRIAAMKNVFLKNGIYPYHIMYDTGLAEELKDLLFTKSNTANERVGGISDFIDKYTEKIVRRPGTLVWEEMKRDAESAFNGAGAGTLALQDFVSGLAAYLHANNKGNNKIKIHIVGHSTGGILFAHLLNALENVKATIESCHLLAPACTVDLYKSTYLEILSGTKSLSLNKMLVYNLKDKLERDDKVGSKILYRKSLLYLVSNAFERTSGGKHVYEMPLLGMEKFKTEIKTATANGIEPEFYYSNGVNSRCTRSTSHGGFDNDPTTMNNILKVILGKKAKYEFTKKLLEY